jgi:cytochrome P450
VRLPGGPSAPAPLQTYEWVAHPTAFLRRCAVRYGDPFTVRTSWADGPMVLVSNPAEIARIGVVVRTHLRMQALTLEVILRVVFGAQEGGELHGLRVAIRRALDMTMSLPRLAAMAIVQRDLGPLSPWGAFKRAVAAADDVLYDLIRRRRAAGHETTATALAWALERLARDPALSWRPARHACGVRT